VHTETSSVSSVSADEQRVLTLTDALCDNTDVNDTVAFLGAQYDAGLAWINFPDGYGGLGLSPKLQRPIQQRIAERGGPLPAPGNGLGYGMGAATVVTHGTEEQKQRYIRPLFTSEEIWCQLFSEPGAGSDLAGLATKAERDGEEWIVNGQKVWNSNAHNAKWGMLVARTDPDTPKHRGLTYFILDMQADGVEVKPLRQMTGQAEFNEVFMNDVRVPESMRVGDVGDGWRVSLTTLMNERVMIGGSAENKPGSGLIGRVRKVLDQYGADSVKLARFMELYTRAEVLRLTNMRAGQLRTAGTPGPEGSVGKITSADLNKEMTEFAIELMGPHGQLFSSFEPQDNAQAAYSDLRAYFLRARANSIEGGTSEIQRNIVGERVLGLPGDVRVDKELPWNQVPR
jgi:alkylation response protein AidB-like acyl-CoA dehydrogenase